MNAGSAMTVIARLARRVRMLASTVTIERVDDATPVQSVQVSGIADGPRDAWRVQQAGFTSVPLAKQKGVALSIGGIRAHLIIIATDAPAVRPQGNPGDSRVYGTDGGGAQVAALAGGKVALGNKASGIEALELVSQLLEQLQVAWTATSLGSQPLDPDTVAKCLELQTKIDAIRGTL